ncbi:MAG: ThuA domain-containing protein [bacterium]|nr:ThuA domain-containing protein [bacterium]
MSNDRLNTDKTTVAVITGGHAFDVPAFRALFDSIPNTDCYIQHLENFSADVGENAVHYDVLLFYTMPRGVPPEDVKGPQSRIRPALEQLGETGQGIFILHHGILTYQDWPFFSDLVDISNRETDSVHFNLSLPIAVANPDHPITQGVEPWEMIDESYVMQEPGENSNILLTCDHPQSMNAIAWTRTSRKSRVFCFQSGHDNQTYTNPGFHTILERGIQWCAGKI